MPLEKCEYFERSGDLQLSMGTCVSFATALVSSSFVFVCNYHGDLPVTTALTGVCVCVCVVCGVVCACVRACVRACVCERERGGGGLRADCWKLILFWAIHHCKRKLFTVYKLSLQQRLCEESFT